MEANNALEVKQGENETGAQAVARKILEPGLRHALSASAFAGKVLGNLEKPGIGDFIGHVQSVSAKAVAGDLSIASELLAAQAITLDAMFTDLAGRASLNMGECGSCHIALTEPFSLILQRSAFASTATTRPALVR